MCKGPWVRNPIKMAAAPCTPHGIPATIGEVHHVTALPSWHCLGQGAPAKLPNKLVGNIRPMCAYTLHTPFEPVVRTVTLDCCSCLLCNFHGGGGATAAGAKLARRRHQSSAHTNSVNSSDNNSDRQVATSRSESHHQVVRIRQGGELCMAKIL
jgi:hypothetical protein